MTDERQDEDEFEKLLRESIDGKSKGKDTEDAPWEGEEDVYTPSGRRPEEAAAPNPKQAAEAADGDPEWDRNIGSAVYAIKGQQVAGGDDAGSDSMPPAAREDGTVPAGDDPSPTAKQSPVRSSEPVRSGGTANWRLGIVSVVAAIAVAGWLVLRDEQGLSRVAAVEQGLADLQQHPATDEQDLEYLERLESRLLDLEAAMAELSRDAESPQTSTDTTRSTDEEEALQQRLSEQELQLNAFEDRIVALEKGAAALRSTSTGRAKAKPRTSVVAPETGKSSGGGWVINLITVSNLDYSTRLLDKYRKQGIEVERLEINSGGKRLYRLRVSGFSSRAKAEDYAGEVRSKLGLKETWITRG